MTPFISVFRAHRPRTVQGHTGAWSYVKDDSYNENWQLLNWQNKITEPRFYQANQAFSNLDKSCFGLPQIVWNHEHLQLI